MSTKIGLLDSDIVAYQVTASDEDKVDWGDGEGIDQIAGDIEGVKDRIDAVIAELKARLKLDDMVICLSCSTADNFRLTVDPTYKGNRANVVRPLHLVAAKLHMEDQYWSYRKPNLEADDVMGILSTHPKLVKGRKLIISEDKDMQTIPGWLFNPRRDVRPRMISVMEADQFHLYQTLIGDTTDGYKGCPGIGPGKANKAFTATGANFATVVRVYMEKLKLEYQPAFDMALVQARLARILRATDYDFKNGVPILWTPDGLTQTQLEKERCATEKGRAA